MTCEFNLPTTELENLQQQYRDNAKSCLEGEKATIQNMIDNIDTILTQYCRQRLTPGLKKAFGLLESQKDLLLQVIEIIDSRNELVDSITITQD